MKRPSRDPGPEIKRQLRREVNFGCPIRYPDGSGCGCPILVFHHFDPQWAGNHIHNLPGMIALCPTHHGQADGNIWTNEQLRLFKKEPFVDDVLRTPWPWSAETLVMKVGPSLVMGSGSPIRLDGLPILRFYPQDVERLGNRTIVFDSGIRDANRQRWLRITDGWFDLRLEKTTEVIFTPQTKTLMAKHDDQTFVSFKFVKKRLDDFKDWDPDTNRQAAKPSRLADVYVFALLACMDKPSIDPLNLDQWEFYVLSTRAINERTRSQHSITQNSLKRLNAGLISYDELRWGVIAAAKKAERSA
jgi:hypothetical protein